MLVLIITSAWIGIGPQLSSKCFTVAVTNDSVSSTPLSVPSALPISTPNTCPHLPSPDSPSTKLMLLSTANKGRVDACLPGGTKIALVAYDNSGVGVLTRFWFVDMWLVSGGLNFALFTICKDPDPGVWKRWGKWKTDTS